VVEVLLYYIGFGFSRVNKIQFRSRVYDFTYHIHKLLGSHPLLERGEVGFEGYLDFKYYY
jgi:hypothetical protein